MTADFSVAVFPFLKTSGPLHIGGLCFRSTLDREGLPADQQKAVAEIADMLFLKDDLRITQASYAICPAVDVNRVSEVDAQLARVHAVVAYIYSSPHPTSGDPFFGLDTVSIVVLTPGPVPTFLVRPDHGTTLLDGVPELVADSRHEVPGYARRYNGRSPLWVVAGSRLYGSRPQMSLNISQDLAHDLDEKWRSRRPDSALLLKMLRSPTNPAAERILSALDWYNTANDPDGDPSRALLHLAIAFETMLHLPASEKTDRLVDAITLLLGRTERLKDWAEQFYTARSEVAHEGRMTDPVYYAGNRRKPAAGAHPIGALMSCGREIFQLCLSTVLVGSNLAGEAGLKAKFVANSERYAAIAKVLTDTAGEAAERLAEIEPLVEGLGQFHFVPSAGLTIAGILGATRAAAQTLLDTKVELVAPVRAAAEVMAGTKRTSGHLIELTALHDLEKAFKDQPLPPPHAPERVVRDLIADAWSKLFMNYFQAGRAAEPKRAP